MAKVSNNGKKYYNNGIVNLMIKEGDIIPEGFVPGMVKRTQEQKEESNKKRKQTNLEKYGAEVPLQSKEIQEKTKKTNLERYGVENVSQAEKIKSKREETFLEKYGERNAFKVKEIQEKTKKTNLERYGAENPFASEKIKEKIKETNLEKYGVEYAVSSEVVRKASRQTLMSNYGVDSPQKSREIKERTKRTNLDRYGNASPMGSDIVKGKSKKTLLRNYGVDNPAKSDVIQERIKKTNLIRYGVECGFQSEEIKEKIKKTCEDLYGVPYACMTPQARKAGSNDSAPNREFEEILRNIGIDFEREFHISVKSYDFRVENVLIEIDPTITHNSLWSRYGGFGYGLDENYHIEKSKLAEDAGYKVIHVFDWDSMDKVARLLLPRETVYARKCEIREVSMDECGMYLQEYHLQGSCRGQNVRIGLYYEDKLVSLMTFGKPRYNKNYQYELIRYCSSYNVIGGAERLFKYFVDTYKPETIISYCDKSKFDGKVYDILGMRLNGVSSPTIHWYNGRSKGKKHITDNLLRQQGADRLLGTNEGKGTSNEEIMIKNHYLPVYDCGQAVYTWETK